MAKPQADNIIMLLNLSNCSRVTLGFSFGMVYPSCQVSKIDRNLSDPAESIDLNETYESFDQVDPGVSENTRQERQKDENHDEFVIADFRIFSFQNEKNEAADNQNN
jgi:hypothetical protein